MFRLIFVIISLVVFVACSSRICQPDQSVEDRVVKWGDKVINLGFDDMPVLFRYSFSEVIQVNGLNDMYKINFFNDESDYSIIYSCFDKEFNIKEIDTLEFYTDFTIIPFPGNRTIRLNTESNSYLLINVLDLGETRTYKEVEYREAPVVKKSIHTGMPTSGSDVSVNLSKVGRKIELKILTGFGLETYLFEDKNDADITARIKFVNLELNQIVFEDNTFLTW